MIRTELRGLYALTPALANTAELAQKARQALAGGARFVQYRNKAADAALRREQAGVLLGLCREQGARLIVNDDLDLALQIGADGVHLGREDGDFAVARASLGPARLLGVSCYSELARARDAQRAGADYVAFGSFFASSTKPDAVRAPLELLMRAKRELDIPVAAIGGITLARAARLIEAGADLLAILSDLFEAADITARARTFSELFLQKATS
jgi:thiamine-phosphate pyrophosphorylase